MKLLQRAFEDGTDKIGQRKWHYEELPPHLSGCAPITCIATLGGSVPQIGMNSLLDWNLLVHPVKGLLPIPSDKE
jgi:hypothetical protein